MNHSQGYISKSSKQGKNQGSFFAPSFIQAKLRVNQPGDPYEREADAVANRVMQYRPGYTFTPVPQKKLMRKCAACAMEGKLQHEGKEQDLETRLWQTRGRGTVLPSNTRAWMESAMGADFGRVRIHTNSNAIQLNRDLNARAFTHGSDIYFNQGEFAPRTHTGQRLLAHELAHVVQQASRNNRRTPQQNTSTASARGEVVQREIITGATISAAAAKCIIGAITGALFDGVIQAALHAWKQRTWRFWQARFDYCSIILSAILGCIAAPVSAYILEGWVVAQLGPRLGGIAGTLIGRILIFIAKKLAIGIPKGIVGKLAKLGCLSPEQAAELGVTPGDGSSEVEAAA